MGDLLNRVGGLVAAGKTALQSAVKTALTTAASKSDPLTGFEYFQEARAVRHLAGEFSIPSVLSANNALYGALEAKPDATVFGTELDELGKSPQVEAYLAELAQISDGTKPPDANLWDFTVRHAGSRDEALKWIATLFQDASGRDEQLKSIRNPKAAASLRTVLGSLNRGALGMELYPESLPIKDAQLYHYYVPAYAAAKMAKNGVQQPLAFTMPFLFNTEYELIGDRFMIDPDPSTVEAAAQDAFQRLLFGNPPLSGRGDPSRIEGSTRDMYLGYRGALFGSGATKTPEPYEPFAKRMAADPDSEIRAVVER